LIRERSPFRYLVNLRSLTKAIVASEPKKAKLEWMNGEGDAARIVGGAKVPLSDLRSAAERLFTEFSKTVTELTFHARLRVAAAWEEDYAREDPSNSTTGFSAISDRSDALLNRIADDANLRSKSYDSIRCLGIRE